MTTVWSHRGYGVENSLTAFQAAWDLGVDHFETDIHVTADGQLILAHDRSISRLTGRDLNIDELKYTELQQFPIQGKESWPTLSDLLSTFGTAKVSIDMKSPNSLFPLVQLLESNIDYRERVIVGSFSSKRVEKFRSLMPEVNTALTVKEILRLKTTGKISNPEGKYAMVPHKFLGRSFLSNRIVELLNESKIPVHVWTVNELESFDRCKKLGVDGVVTDEVPLAKSFFEQHSG
ncbi:MAG: glycerophosphodiester phosphodiesterase [Candidatus Nanopelagicales bacterium]